ncbi:MAG: thioredoxin family protein [Phaeodactylibacter sp.]|uniref:thioredoxin family protein n=1 Tax=Phaeodactylibacter sp. TaxID=1940289 RepID=UPI0032F07822
MKKIAASVIEQAMSYSEYRAHIESLRTEGKTTGANHSEAMLHYTDLNRSRMSRLDKTSRLTPETLGGIERLQAPVTMLVLTEAWCGDAAQVIPVLQKLAEASPRLSLKLILRDEHPDIMDAFLTNGGRSIPKIIFINDSSGEVAGSWGPRPAAVQQIVIDYKTKLQQLEDAKAKKVLQQETIVETQKWYARDKTKSIQSEVMQALLQHHSVLTH